ncbi:uncharacterized protein Z518_06433 [Rhinocladiella mackenziei CBS 650.93]|uniref:Rhinocladiella mackenziei CBS 650.93 unplaced genomic scaffold supercont1.4, whole genome shotgun sequence n=1 Tax=Rhinocladiella mackenziei CBS 650.93 TaxID=1442369 RepID=A0A0D2IQY1_9EURO|nr:uncharacterized protein Z518_06433 [Rhinocladiella mackenziei CBS 650.93]KIX05561.1 hypothetical protein Z518_06433 [Rhinocladiella mackenziei CBS 650.93]
MSPKLLVVLGATGTQGGSIINTFQNDPEWTIRGITRNVNSSKAEILKSKGVKVISANLDDPSSLMTAFKGAYAIFSVTDFWAAYKDPANQTKRAPGQAMNVWSYEHELEQGKNVFDAAAKTDGLQRMIFSSLSYAKKWSGGKYSHVYHLDSKAEAVEYGRLKYPELWKKTSIIQIGYYLSNIWTFSFLKPTKDENGVYVFASKMRPDVKLPLIAAEEDTGPLTKALLATEPGKNLIAYREWMTLDEFYHVWSETLGVRAKTVALPADDPWEAVPEELREELSDTMLYAVEFGYEARDDSSVIHPKDLDVQVQLGTVQEWIKKQDWGPVLRD